MLRSEGIPYKPGDPLPIGPGSILYEMTSNHFYEIREHQIHGVAVYNDRCCAVLDTEIFPIVKDCEPSEVDDVFFATREDAIAWQEKHLNNPPYFIEDCDRWVSPEQYLPKCHGYEKVYVKLQTLDGIIKTDAYYEDGSKYPEDKGFWDGIDRHSKKLSNVVAWIKNKAWDPETTERRSV